MFHFVRSVGSSYFISASVVVVFHTHKVSYSELVQWINPFNNRLSLPSVIGRLEYREHNGPRTHRW